MIRKLCIRHIISIVILHGKKFIVLRAQIFTFKALNEVKAIMPNKSIEKYSLLDLSYFAYLANKH